MHFIDTKKRRLLRFHMDRRVREFVESEKVVLSLERVRNVLKLEVGVKLFGVG